MKTARVGDAGAVVRDENSRRSASRSEPLLGFVDGGQGRLEDRRILFLCRFVRSATMMQPARMSASVTAPAAIGVSVSSVSMIWAICARTFAS